MGEISRQLGSHNLLTTPTKSPLNDPESRPLLDRYLLGVGKIGAEARSRIFRLTWDFSGSAMASRNGQYERFYPGSASRNQQQAPLTALFARERADRLVNRFLNEPVP